MVFSGREFQELFHKAKVVDEALMRLTPDKPREAIVPPSLQMKMQGSTATLTATPNGPQPISELELWLNGHRLIRRLGNQLPGGDVKSLQAEIPSDYLRAPTAIS